MTKPELKPLIEKVSLFAGAYTRVWYTKESELLDDGWIKFYDLKSSTAVCIHGNIAIEMVEDDELRIESSRSET